MGKSSPHSASNTRHHVWRCTRWPLWPGEVIFIPPPCFVYFFVLVKAPWLLIATRFCRPCSSALWALLPRQQPPPGARRPHLARPRPPCEPGKAGDRTAVNHARTTRGQIAGAAFRAQCGPIRLVVASGAVATDDVALQTG